MHFDLRALLQRPQGLPDGEALGADIKDEAAQQALPADSGSAAAAEPGR